MIGQQPRRLRLGIAAIALSAMVAVSCGTAATQPSGTTQVSPDALNFNTSTVPWLSANQNATGSPKFGGTLKILGTSDIDHLDTASAYLTNSSGLMRAISRQLYTYPASTDMDVANRPVADIAAAMPTVSADGKSVTVKLRTDVMWNTSPARVVTSKDFLYGFKRLCNPVAPVGAPAYFTATIVGFKDYCTAFGNVGTDLPSVQAFLAANTISGITTPDDSTVVFNLLVPTPDLLNILSLPFSSAAPQEFNQYLPDSSALHDHWISDGPYTVATYTPGQEIDLSKNTTWTQAADPVRHQYVDHIQIIEGQTDQGVQQQLDAGTGDLGWDTVVPTASIPALSQPTRDPRFGTFPTPDLDPYIAFNLQSPNNKGALANVKVRQALEYAIDKAAIAKIFGGPDFTQVLNQVLPPGSSGFSDLNPYSTPGNAGDPAKCKQLLTAAGVSNLTLHDEYQNTGLFVSVSQEIKKDLEACGVTVIGTAASSSDAFSVVSNPSSGTSGVWDITEFGWVPDWHGNNGRSSIQPLFDGRNYGPGSSDYGNYNSPVVNALIDKALAATSSADAASLWQQADVQIMQDAPVIPIRSESSPVFRSTRVHNAIWFGGSTQYDITQVWLG